MYIRLYESIDTIRWVIIVNISKSISKSVSRIYIIIYLRLSYDSI